MKHKLSKILLTCPIAATAILPMTTFTSCHKNDETYHIALTAKGAKYIEVIAQKHLRARLEPENFPSYLINELYGRTKTYIHDSWIEAIQGSSYAKEYGEEVVESWFYEQNVDWENHPDYATFTLTPQDGNYDKVIFFLHGGGYAKNINYIHIDTIIQLCEKLHAKFYIALHPVLPQHDVKECYEYLNYTYVDMCLNEPNKDIIMMGDSSGGGLSLAYSEYLYNMQYVSHLPIARILFSPWVDVTMKNPDIEPLVDGDLMLHPYGLSAYGRLWANWAVSWDDPLVSPINCNLNDKVRTLIFAGEKECLNPDIKLLHKKLRRNGCESKLVIADGLFHDFGLWIGMDECQTAFNMIEKFLNKQPIQ